MGVRPREEGASQTCFLLTLPLSLFDFGTVMAVNVRASDGPLQIDPPPRLCSLTRLCSQTFTFFFSVAFALPSKGLVSELLGPNESRLLIKSPREASFEVGVHRRELHLIR